MKEVILIFLIPTTLSCSQSSSSKQPPPTPQEIPEYNYAAIRDGVFVSGLPVQDTDHISLAQALEEQDSLYIQPSGWSKILNALKRISCRR